MTEIAHYFMFSRAKNATFLKVKRAQNKNSSLIGTVTEPKKTYNGYVKSQILSELNLAKGFKKGTARLFRMLFSLKEGEGRSLYGNMPNKGPQRPALEDQQKVKFIEDIIIETWPYTPLDAIRNVIRDDLKPSRVESRKKAQ